MQRCILVIGALASLALAQSVATTTTIEKVSRAVVLISGSGPKGSASGSGFLVSTDGKIVTSLHVIRGLTTATVKLPNGWGSDRVSVLAIDEDRDLAILEINGTNLPTIELGDSSRLSPGAPVVLIGSPLGLEGTVTSGIISAIRTLSDDLQVIQNDAATNPGNSGGPLLNVNCDAIGVIGFKIRNAENLNFAIPISYVRQLLGRPFAAAVPLSKLYGHPEDRSKARESTPEEFPSVWKSTTNGLRLTLRYDGERIFAEVLMSAQQRQAGAYYTSSLTRAGSQFKGLSRAHFNCQSWSYLRAEWDTKQCNFEGPIEISFISPDRVEGKSEQVPLKNPGKCSCELDTKKTSWQAFTWIPE